MRGFLASRRYVTISHRAMVLGLVLLAGIVPRAMTAEPGKAPQSYFPAKGLVAYVEFDGLRAHAKAWEATAAFAMLARTPAGAMMTDLAVQVTDRFLKLVPGSTITGADLVALQEHLVHEGFAIGVHRRGDDVYSWTIVVAGAGRKGSRQRFERFLQIAFDPEPPARVPDPVRLRGREVNQLKTQRSADHGYSALSAGPDAVAPAVLPTPGAPATAPTPPTPPAPEVPILSWWFEKDDLVLISGALETSSPIQDPVTAKRIAATHADHFASVIDALEGKQANVTTHPAYASAASEGKDIKGFESDGLFFIDSGRKGGLLGYLLESPSASPLAMLGLPSIPESVETRAPTVGLPYGPPGNAYAPAPAVAPAAYGTPAPAPPDTSGAASPKAPPQQPGSIPDSVPPLPPDADSPSSPPPAPYEGPRPSPSSVLPPAVPPAYGPPGTGPSPDARPVAAAVAREGGAPREGEKPKAAGKPVDPAQLLGLDGITRIVGRWGFQGKALLTDVRIEAPVPRKGLVGWLDQPAFHKDQLPPIPQATREFVVDSFDPALAYGRFIDLTRKIEPETGLLIDEMEKAAKEIAGVRLREDILSRLGPTWCVLPVRPADDQGGGKAEPDPTDYVLVASLNDPDGFAKVLDTLAARANQYLRDREKPNDGAVAKGRQLDPPALAVERLPAPNRGYRLTSPARLVFWLNDEIQPTILVGKSYVAFASNAERAAEALAFERDAGGRWRPTGELIPAFDCLPEKLTLLSVGDSRDSVVPETLAQLPSIVQLIISGLGGMEDPEAGMAADFLTLFGVPGPGSFRIRIDPARIPKSEDLRSHLFPSVLAAAVDDRGIRFIGREAFPFACTGNSTYLKSSMKWDGSKGLKRELKVGMKWLSGQ